MILELKTIFSDSVFLSCQEVTFLTKNSSTNGKDSRSNSAKWKIGRNTECPQKGRYLTDDKLSFPYNIYTYKPTVWMPCKYCLYYLNVIRHALLVEVDKCI